MEHGTLWGHGAYLGPDYSARYLHTTTEISRETLSTARHGKTFAALEPAQAAGIADAVRTDLKTNRYDAATDTLTFTRGEEASFVAQKA